MSLVATDRARDAFIKLREQFIRAHTHTHKEILIKRESFVDGSIRECRIKEDNFRINFCRIHSVDLSHIISFHENRLLDRRWTVAQILISHYSTSPVENWKCFILRPNTKYRNNYRSISEIGVFSGATHQGFIGFRLLH